MKIGSLACNKVRALRAAFTLPEVMMAVAVSSVVFVTLYLGIAEGVVVVKNCRESLRATQILEEKAEIIRLISWNQITNGIVPQTFTDYYDPTASSGKKGVTYQGTTSLNAPPITETYSGTMKLFVITVKWTSAGIQRQKEIRTFVSQYGLQNYVYPLTKPSA
jgi:prepilin-type N-terminal cleavage/methylation domain-containing protein